MPFCPKCGTEILTDSKYCSSCGAILTVPPSNPVSGDVQGSETVDAPVMQDMVPPPELDPELPPVSIPPLDPIPDCDFEFNPSSETSVEETALPTPAYKPPPTPVATVASKPYRTVTPAPLVSNRKLGTSEKVFTFFAVLLYGTIGAGLLTAMVAFFSTFVGDPFNLRPTLRGWGMNLWEDQKTNNTAFVQSPAVPGVYQQYPVPQDVTVPSATVPIEAPQTPPSFNTAPTMSINMTVKSGNALTKENVQRRVARVKPSMKPVLDTWERVLRQDPNYPACSMTMNVDFDNRGRTKNVVMTKNKDVPKTLSDSALNAMRRVAIVPGEPFELAVRLEFGK